jgi:HlyD family secretion protein
VLKRYTWLVLALAIGVVVFARFSVAEDPPSPQAKDKEKPKEENEKPKVDSNAAKNETVKVEKGPLTAAIVLKGTVQSDAATEISIKLKNWTGQLLARKSVEHGTAVKAGDVLVEFEVDKLDREIRDAKQGRELSQVAIRQAELELPILEKQAPIDLAAAERDYKEAVDDLKRFTEIDRKMLVQSVEFMLKSANFYLDYSKEELKQLQKMYRDKDLTEETEQMILKRYKFSVESAEMYAANARIDSEQALKIFIPRREQLFKNAVEKAEIALAKAREVQPLALQQKRLALTQLKYEETKAKEKLDELELERAALIVKAPVDGVAYYGRSVRGQWMVPAGSQGPSLSGVGPINPGDVFLTIVAPGKVIVRADVEEKELAGLKAGLKGRITPTAYPNKKLPCEVAHVGAAPSDGKFDVKIKLTGKTDDLVPGMTGSVRFVTSQKKSALTVPSTAVFEDTAEDTHYVYRVGKDGKHTKKTIKVGITSGDKTEILEGLSEGDEILSSKP